MNIAFDFSSKKIVPFREGICVYNAFLFQALLENYPDVSIEIFTNEINVPEIKRGMAAYYSKFEKRIEFVTPQSKPAKWHEISWGKFVGYSLKQLFYSLLLFIEKKEKYGKKKKNLLDKKKALFSIEIKSLSELASESNADVVFSDFVTLNVGNYFKCPKVFMLHDLFTIPLADLFRDSVSNIDEINQNAVENLQQYANEGAYFITSGKYIRDEQLLKYIKNLPMGRTMVIPFPPMIRTFKLDSLMTEKEFRDRFKINGAYIPYASQNRPNKNVILLLKALKRLKDKGIQITVVTTGDFCNIKKCAEFIDKNSLGNYIRQIGTISEDELYALYKYSSMVVVPTIIEGLGMSGQCLEALSFGSIPVVHAKSWGIKESLESVGLSMETADLNWVDLDDDKGLADKIEDVLSNPYPHIEKQKHIIEAYTKRTWADVAHDYMNVFKQAIKENRK